MNKAIRMEAKILIGEALIQLASLSGAYFKISKYDGDGAAIPVCVSHCRLHLRIDSTAGQFEDFLLAGSASVDGAGRRRMYKAGRI